MRIVFYIALFLVSLSVKASDDFFVINITTDNDQLPSCDVINAPDGCYGTTIINNNYLSGRMIITKDNNTLYDSGNYVKNVSGMKIKRRGNSSGAFLDQHPYKIKLSTKHDLLMRGDESFSHKEWVLMSLYVWNTSFTNAQSNITNIAATLISNILKKEWTPAYTFVQVYINNYYQGLYYLMESVDRGERRVNISKSGFLIEHDAFWWKEDVYFKTSHQDPAAAFTFKYPDDEDTSAHTPVIDYMENVEDIIYNDGDIDRYINLESFAKWLLIHDILGTTDLIGSNIFLCNKDIVADSKLEMGPIWDYDTMLKSQTWSGIHSSDWFYYNKLLQNEQFVNKYLQLWNKFRPNLLSKIDEGLEAAATKYEAAFDREVKKHKEKYPHEGVQSFRSQINEMKSLIKKRIQLLDLLFSESYPTTIVNIKKSKDNNVHIYNLQGIKVATPDKGIYIKNHRKIVRRPF